MAEAGKNWSLEGERRVVTILFCDLVGSTAAAGQLDPENWAEIINQAFEHMIEPVYKYEGIVARLMGDAILAFFGAPVAHEDDPERAVRAGLDIIKRFNSFSKEIQQQWQVEIDVRVGINTGLVLVGQVGSDLQMEYTALGDAINLASRMEQLAEPGTVQIAEETYKAIRQIFEVEDLGEVEVKGKNEPVRAYRAIVERTERIARRGLPGRSAPLIGRDEEWRALIEAAETNLKGVGQVVFLLGEAGLGKSRLIRELKAECMDRAARRDGDRPHIAWYETTSLSYETSMPYSMFQRLLREMIGAGPGEGPEQLHEKISWFDPFFPGEDALRVRQVFESLFSLESRSGLPRLEGEAFRGQLYNLISDFLVALTHNGPLILVFDDLHWIDPASAELIEHLLNLVNSYPILILCASRPERQSAGWRLRQIAEDKLPHRYSEIYLKALSEAESEKLAEKLLNIGDLPEDFKIRILRRAEGNPFFVEEVVRALTENGRVAFGEDGVRWIDGEEGEFEIPDTVQSLLTARIDRLPEESRRVLQLAALIGRTFYYRILAAILGGNKKISLDQELDILQRAAFIRETARQPELEYIFQHMLTQEAAYHTILHQHRRQYHRLVGEVMENLFTDQIESHAPRLAHHFYEARDYMRAFRYNLMTGNSAIRLFAGQEAVRHYDHARNLLRDGRVSPAELDRETIEDFYKKRGRALELTYGFAEALENYDELEQIGKQLGDRSLELSALIRKGTVRSIISDQYDPVLAMELSQAALDLAAELNDQAATARIYWNLMNQYRNSGLGNEALWAGEKSLALAKEHNLRQQIAFTSNDLSYVYMMNSQMENAVAVTTTASHLWEELGNLPMLADSLSALAGFKMVIGELDEAIRISDRAFDLSAQIRNMWGQSHSKYMIGAAHWLRGEIDKAVETMLDAASNAERARFIFAQIWCRCDYASLLIDIGLFDLALEILDEAEEASHSVSEYLPYIHAMRNFIAFRKGMKTERIPPFDFSERGPRVFTAPSIEHMRVIILLEQGRPEEAHRILVELEKFESTNNMKLGNLVTKYWMTKVLSALGQDEEMRSLQDFLFQKYENLELRWLRWKLYADLSEGAKSVEERISYREKAMEDVVWISNRLTREPVRTAVLNLFRSRSLGPPAMVNAPEKG